LNNYFIRKANLNKTTKQEINNCPLEFASNDYSDIIKLFNIRSSDKVVIDFLKSINLIIDSFLHIFFNLLSSGLSNILKKKKKKVVPLVVPLKIDGIFFLLNLPPSLNYVIFSGNFRKFPIFQ
jgi:hypothetical protein